MQTAVEMIAHVGSAAGLHPELMLAGAAGGWLAHTYQPPAEFAARFTRVVLSALAATWCTPLAVQLMQLPAEPGLVKFPLALGFGLLTMDVLGHGVIAFARKWFKGKAMADFIAQFIGLVACAVIIWRAEPALNRMSEGTHMAVRLAIWTTLIGAVARTWWIAVGGVPDYITVLMLVAFAMLISCERRLQVLTRRTRPSSKTPVS